MNRIKRISAWLLSVALIASSLIAGVSIGGIEASATTVPEDATVIIACSDYQNSDEDELSDNVTAILSTIKESGYDSVDGFFCAGDYTKSSNSSTSKTKKGISALRSDYESVYGSVAHEVMVQGNHDKAGASGLSSSGNNDAEAYGVFVINEDDYMEACEPDDEDDKETVQATAASLKAYLDEKEAQSYTKPIFVVSHLPLHYSKRSYSEGDAIYAHYIFDVLNEASKDGLNIIFMFGHNHSSGFDNYIGGAASYLTKGSTINIAKEGSQTEYDVETLNFTYMNAGYIGNYSTSNKSVDDELTMTAFVITEDSVTIERYDASGLHNLKSCGGYSNTKEETTMSYEPDTTVVPSPQVIMLNKEKPDPGKVRGDANRDGVVGAADVTTLARHLAQIKLITDEETLALCNVDGKGTLPDAGDVTHIARYLANIISEL